MGGQVVGYISCTLRYNAMGGKTGDEGVVKPSAATSMGEHGALAHINHLVVLPDHRNRGIGRMLFEELMCYLNDTSPSVIADLRLSVAGENKHAVEWYGRLVLSNVANTRCTQTVAP